jgi:hypothetical protein
MVVYMVEVAAHHRQTIQDFRQVGALEVVQELYGAIIERFPHPTLVYILQVLPLQLVNKITQPQVHIHGQFLQD